MLVSTGRRSSAAEHDADLHRADRRRRSALATAAGIEAGRIGARLHRAEQRVSALALAAERERIGRDLHDILGHSLTAISIKADLAGKLARSRPGRGQGADRRGLRDRPAVAGRRPRHRVGDPRGPGRPSEIASARSVLLAAGIESSCRRAIEPMPDETSELFGYVVREAVTNVVRHSEARRCVITVDAHTGDGHRRRRQACRTVPLAVGLRGAPATARRRRRRLDVGLRPAGRDHDPAPACRRAEHDRRGRRLVEVASAMISVLLVDDQALIRQAFAALLELESDLTVVGQAADAATAVDAGRRAAAGRRVDGRANARRPTRTATTGWRPPPTIMAARPRHPGDRVDHLRSARDTCAAPWRPEPSGSWSRTHPADRLIEGIRRVHRGPAGGRPGAGERPA